MIKMELEFIITAIIGIILLFTGLVTWSITWAWAWYFYAMFYGLLIIFGACGVIIMNLIDSEMEE